jgi:hypothetical protein
MLRMSPCQRPWAPVQGKACAGPLKHNGALCDIALKYARAWSVGRSLALGLSLRDWKKIAR